jgi:hypothetical protein
MILIIRQNCLFQGWTNPESQDPVTTKILCWHLIFVDPEYGTCFMVPRILRRLLDFENFVHPCVISLHIFDRRVFCGEPKCLLWGRRFTWRPLPSIRVSRRALPAQSRVLFQVSPYEICTGKSDTGTAFSQSISAFPCLYHSTNTPYSSLSTICFTRRKKGQSLEICQKAMLFRKSRTLGEERFSLFFKEISRTFRPSRCLWVSVA